MYMVGLYFVRLKKTHKYILSLKGEKHKQHRKDERETMQMTKKDIKNERGTVQMTKYKERKEENKWQKRH